MLSCLWAHNIFLINCFFLEALLHVSLLEEARFPFFLIYRGMKCKKERENSGQIQFHIYESFLRFYWLNYTCWGDNLFGLSILVYLFFALLFGLYILHTSMQSFHRTLTAKHAFKPRALFHNLQKIRFLSVTRSSWSQEKPETKIQDFRKWSKLVTMLFSVLVSCPALTTDNNSLVIKQR